MYHPKTGMLQRFYVYSHVKSRTLKCVTMMQRNIIEKNSSKIFLECRVSKKFKIFFIVLILRNSSIRMSYLEKNIGYEGISSYINGMLLFNQ